jgi:hypothetical protein
VIIILILSFTIAPMPLHTFSAFIIGSVLLLIGMSLFNLGAQTAMMPIGERIGSYVTKSRNIWIIGIVSFVIGAFITVSEPDLQVLAEQIPTIPNFIMLLAVGMGVGFFLLVAMVRMFFHIPLNRILIVCYAVVFGLAFFAPKDFLAVAFDAGGVTTGPMTVPFIMALGLGVAAIRSDKHTIHDSFGLVALSSVGPILVVMLLGFIYSADSTYTPVEILEAFHSRELWGNFADSAQGFPFYAKEMIMALAPIVAFFLVFQFIGLKLEKHPFLKICVGIIYTFAGLVLFLTGVNVGFMPAGYYLGQTLGGLSYNWIVIPIAMVIGYFIVAAEPAVQVLNKQVEEISTGTIPAKVMNIGLSVGMCISLGLATVRVMTGIPILWFLLPGYLFAIILSFFVPKLFTAIAFDSGGVASGPMTATFLLPFSIGLCTAVGGNVVTDAFGIVAMVAMTPLITIQIMGLAYKIQLSNATKKEDEAISALTVEEQYLQKDTGIVEF